MTRIPLESVAPDQRASIEAFRSAGGRSFQDHGTMAAARAAYVASARANGLAPVAVRRVDDVAIGSGDEAFTVRVYDPRPVDAGAPTDAVGRAGDPAPVVLFFHAGGWIIGDLDTHDAVCRFLADRLGTPVVAVDYRLGPEHRFPAAHVDAVRAVEWVRDEADARGWDPSRLAVVGDSAGGGLATMLAAQPGASVPGTRILAQALLYPVLDVSTESGSYARVDADAGVPLTAATMRWFAENALSDDPARAATEALDHRVSPLLFARDAALADAGRAAAPQPHAFVLSLGLDPLCDGIVEYASLLGAVGTHVEHVHLPSHAHGLCTSAGRVAAGRDVLERTAAFVERVLGEAVPL